MKKTRKPAKPVSADAIARLADQGKDVSRFFKGQGRMVQPTQRVNADVTATMSEESDKAAQGLNVSRPAGIKIRVDELDIPMDERTFSEKLKELWPDYEIQIELREAEWLPSTWEHIRVFIQNPVTVAVAGYLAKMVSDIFVEWAKERVKNGQSRGKLQKLTLYGLDGKAIKVISVKE